MSLNFWKKLKKPIMVLAPMADVTDPAFRFIIAKYSKYGGQNVGEYGNLKKGIKSLGGPDVFWTEFVSADGLMFAPEEGRKKLLRSLMYSELERPVVAQLFTSNPKSMKEIAKLTASLGFDGFDINMGCPDRSIEKQGAGASLIKNPELAKELILAAKEGISEVSSSVEKEIPVSVKTRAGYNKEEIDTWIPKLLEADPAVITIHARTRKEMSKVPARWELVKQAVQIRDELEKETLIFGNGDAKSISHTKGLVEECGADGAMLGKAIFGNPWLFRDDGEYVPSVRERLEVLVEHSILFEKLLGDLSGPTGKSFSIMKKHFKAYVSGWPDASDLRIKLMGTENAKEVQEVIEDYLLTLS